MIIDGSQYNINILILYMKNESLVTVETVETLLEGLEDGVTVSLLLNGGTDPEMRALAEGVDCLRYYESPENLGVAGGRNLLLGTEECRNCDIVMILDNDLVPPVDYVRSLATFLVRHKEAGVVGGAAADINFAGMDAIRRYGHTGRWGGRIFRLTCSEIREFTLRDIDTLKLYHVGIHPDYYYSYFSAGILPRMVAGKIGALFGRQRSHHPILKFNEKWLGMIADGAEILEVSNVAGCSQAFRRKLLDEIGGLNDLFNPYGYEDVDFCLRAIRAGYRNYIDLGTWVYHGTDTRHSTRGPGHKAEMNFRGRTVLAALNFHNPLKVRLIMLKLLLSESARVLLARTGNSAQVIPAMYRGYRKGLEVAEDNGLLCGDTGKP